MNEPSIRPFRLPVVGVIGSGAEAHEELATPLGRFLAQAGVHLLTGGGRGTMESVSRAFAETPGRRGLVLAILPCHPDDPARPKDGYPNEWVEIAIRTHLPLSGARGTELLSRNHLNVLSSDALIALPGGPGTKSEIELAHRYSKPLVAFGPTDPAHDPRESETHELHRVETIHELASFLRSALGEMPPSTR
ncbi:MAG TPA: hypothetical protein VK116_06895 [Planctomycetota bacterium]|nr:hypothetical protein [Planctomycetota bacterium]